MHRIPLVDDEPNILMEAESPGITQVNWGPNGEVLLNEEEPT